MSQLHLSEIEETGEQRAIALQWAQYLLDEYDSNGAIDALGLYDDVGWISDDVRQEMEDLLSSTIVEQQTEYEKPSLDWPPLNALKDTQFEGHAVSIAFIVKLSDASREDIDGGDILTS